MEQTKISLTNPCSKSWDDMEPTANGKHCASCKKNVVDFTKMDIDEIKSYLESKKNEIVCARVTPAQARVARPKHHQFLVELYLKIENNFKLPILKNAVLGLIVLCMAIVGCNRPTTSDLLAMNEKNDAPFKNNTMVADTPTLPAPAPIRVGTVRYVRPDTLRNNNPTFPEGAVGSVMYVEPDTIEQNKWHVEDVTPFQDGAVGTVQYVEPNKTIEKKK
jgi:hypothetical protein